MFSTKADAKDRLSRFRDRLSRFRDRLISAQISLISEIEQGDAGTMKEKGRIVWWFAAFFVPLHLENKMNY